MTSFLRTRKDRHPKPESKVRLPQEHTQSGDHQRNDAGQAQVHRAYQDIRDVPASTERRDHEKNATNKSNDGSKRPRGMVRPNHNGTLTLSLDKPH